MTVSHRARLSSKPLAGWWSPASLALSSALRDEYRRLWLESNSPGGLEASIAEKY